jgi:hypothetical protein
MHTTINSVNLKVVKSGERNDHLYYNVQGFRKSRAKIKKANSLVRLFSRVNLTNVDGCFV